MIILSYQDILILLYEIFLKNNPQKKFYVEFVNLLIKFQDFGKAQEVLQSAILKYPKDKQVIVQ